MRASELIGAVVVEAASRVVSRASRAALAASAVRHECGCVARWTPALLATAWAHLRGRP